MLFAHGVGSRGDLPLPLWMFAWATAIALVLSFLALGVLWTRPVLARAATGRALPVDPAAAGPAGWATRTALVLGRSGAMALLVVALWAGLAGTDSSADNVVPVLVYVQVWVGLTLISGLVGDLWRAVSPFATLARVTGSLAARVGHAPAPAPPRLGRWPGAAGLFVFLFYELVHPSGDSPRVLGVALAVHTIVVVVAAVAWGPSWVADNEPLAVLFSLLAAMAPIHVEDGRLRLRAPVAGLARVPVPPGATAALLVVLGGTTFDGFSESEAGRAVLGRPSGWEGAIVLTAGLVASILAIAALYRLGVAWTARITALDTAGAAAAFTPSLIPIVFGYAVAHYAQLLVDETQTFVFHLSDPAGLGWDLFGGADGRIDFDLVSVDLIAWIQIAAILFGHIGAVLVAHDRSVELFPAGQATRSQFTMLAVMVAYSTLGLWLLLNA